jgi:putative redox protein
MATVTISHIPGTAYQTRIETEGLAITGDEPLESGGDGLGPSPYEFLLAGLGHCTVLTILLYARRKAWPVERVAVRATHERLVMDDTSSGELVKKKLERITQVIAIDGPIDDVQRARLLEIAGKCPVHRTLTGQVEIVEVAAPPLTLISLDQ